MANHFKQIDTDCSLYKLFVKMNKPTVLFVWTSYLDINDIAELVGLQVGGQVLDTLLLVGAREHVSRSASVTIGVHHFESCPEKAKN